MKLHVGTSGYSYKEWKGNFYPEDLPAREMLAYYSRRLPAVEINNTFYRLPQPGMIENWKEQVPKRFRFSIKASQRITHIKRINNVADETKYLLETAALLEERLGVVLFQLPPNMKKDIDRLKAFLDLLSANVRSAFEFRHESWSDDEVFDLLRAKKSHCPTDCEVSLSGARRTNAQHDVVLLHRCDVAPLPVRSRPSVLSAFRRGERLPGREGLRAANHVDDRLDIFAGEFAHLPQDGAELLKRPFGLVDLFGGPFNL